MYSAADEERMKRMVYDFKPNFKPTLMIRDL